MFFECFDLAVMSIRSRFDQKGFKTFSNVEQLLFKACKGQNYEEELDFVCNFFTNDFNKIELAAELLMSIVLSGHPGVQLDTRVDSKKSFCRSVMEGT